MATDDVVRIEVDDRLRASEIQVSQHQIGEFSRQHALGAVAAQSAVGVVFASKESGIVAKRERRHGVSRANGKVPPGVRYEEGPAHLAPCDNVSKGSLGSEGELRERGLKQGHRLDGTTRGLRGGSDKPRAEGMARQMNTGGRVLCMKTFEPWGETARADAAGAVLHRGVEGKIHQTPDPGDEPCRASRSLRWRRELEAWPVDFVQREIKVNVVPQQLAADPGE